MITARDFLSCPPHSYLYIIDCATKKGSNVVDLSAGHQIVEATLKAVCYNPCGSVNSIYIVVDDVELRYTAKEWNDTVIAFWELKDAQDCVGLEK